MTERDNVLRAVRFERPERIPVVFHINAACWHHYPDDALRELMASHPFLFPPQEDGAQRRELEYDPSARAGQPYTDPWGCVWETTDDGIMGTVTQHPLADWGALDDLAVPDPQITDGRGPVDWTRVAAGFRQAKGQGRLACGGLPHGHTFMMLMYLRGYESLVIDMADGDPPLQRLVDLLEEFNLAVVQRYLAAGAEWMGYAEDLGMQVGPMVSPLHFAQYIQPSYRRLIAPARDAGCVIHMHSDGDIRALVDGIVEGGVEVVNLQDLVNGVEWIREHLRGRVCVELDIDRQQITRFGTPAAIDALIRDEVTQLGSREGGLMLIFGLYPGTPLTNVAALMDALEKYSTHFS